jgi:hypothetical protein
MSIVTRLTVYLVEGMHCFSMAPVMACHCSGPLYQACFSGVLDPLQKHCRRVCGDGRLVPYCRHLRLLRLSLNDRGTKARGSVSLPAKTFFMTCPGWIAGIASPETKPGPDLKVVRAAWHDGSYDDEAVVPVRS